MVGFGFGLVFGVIADAQEPWFNEGMLASFNAGLDFSTGAFSGGASFSCGAASSSTADGTASSVGASTSSTFSSSCCFDACSCCCLGAFGLSVPNAAAHEPDGSPVDSDLEDCVALAVDLSLDLDGFLDADCCFFKGFVADFDLPENFLSLAEAWFVPCVLFTLFAASSFGSFFFNLSFLLGSHLETLLLTIKSITISRA